MTFPSSFHMPGAFHPDGVHPGLFRPPVSPSPTSDYLPSSNYAAESTSKRKWRRSDVPRVHDMVSDGFFDGPGFLDTAGAAAAAAMPSSKAYMLAGQVSTPTIGHEVDDVGMMDDSVFSDSDYRRALGSKRMRNDEVDRSPPNVPTPLFNLPDKPAPASGWGNFAFTTIGGVVGKVWEFCRGGGFKGFYAGGGTTYKITPGGDIAQGSPVPDARTEDHFCFSANSNYPSMPTFEYGNRVDRQRAFPAVDEPFAGMSDYSPCGSGTSTPTGPATKRRHTDYTNELGRNWVLIKDSAPTEKRTARKVSTGYLGPPRNQNQGPSPPTGRRIATPNSRQPVASAVVNSHPARPASRVESRTESRMESRPSSRMSDASSIRQPARPASAASFASFSGFNTSPPPSRIPVQAASTASVASPTMSLQGQSTPRRRRNTAVPSPSQPVRHGHRRNNSAASVASGRSNDVSESPRLDDEARQLATRRRKEERDTDVRMAAFNKRLQAMIRQGKEALGTTIEVDDMDEDAGWEDEN